MFITLAGSYVQALLIELIKREQPRFSKNCRRLK
nr:MAG TPA: hypothetical protein [Siphoviridae sp. ct8IY7]DAN38455.1 MAG TPA: hypothetical protein [Caudoviricetes sp.]DAT01509.1 MAG TPA: hypothetical protein [Bacteriophage sp.]DAQ62849.1 MAG TPA: hypothetical protein [Caudoviricetes sp.]DAU96359.1 MAG TPA: hypothetical protein [Caudoviricetes sp.]